MISLEILTKKGTLVKLSQEEAEEVYQALKKMFDKKMDYPQYPVLPYNPFYPYYPNWNPIVYYPEVTYTTTTGHTEGDK